MTKELKECKHIKKNKVTPIVLSQKQEEYLEGFCRNIIRLEIDKYIKNKNGTKTGKDK